MKPIKYYLSRLMAIFSPECYAYHNGYDGCYESSGDESGQFLCGDTRGWFDDGTRCQHLEKNRQGLLAKSAERVAEGLLQIGGIKD